MKFDKKNRRTNFEYFISHLFDELHCSNICYMIRLVFICQNLFFIAPTRSKYTINFGTFVTGLKPTFWCWSDCYPAKATNFVWFCFFSSICSELAGENKKQDIFFYSSKLQGFSSRMSMSLYICICISISCFYSNGAELEGFG